MARGDILTVTLFIFITGCATKSSRSITASQSQDDATDTTVSLEADNRRQGMFPVSLTYSLLTRDLRSTRCKVIAHMLRFKPTLTLKPRCKTPSSSARCLSSCRQHIPPHPTFLIRLHISRRFLAQRHCSAHYLSIRRSESILSHVTFASRTVSSRKTCSEMGQGPRVCRMRVSRLERGEWMS